MLNQLSAIRCQLYHQSQLYFLIKVSKSGLLVSWHTSEDDFFNSSFSSYMSHPYSPEQAFECLPFRHAMPNRVFFSCPSSLIVVTCTTEPFQSQLLKNGWHLIFICVTNRPLQVIYSPCWRPVLQPLDILITVSFRMYHSRKF